MAHTPNGFKLGSPNLFVKGMAEAIVTDVVTGDIIGYDNVATESSVSTEVNMGEITGGVGNPLLISIPDTTRITGTLTSQAFSLHQRALTVGGEVGFDGIVQRCIPNVAPVSGTLYIPLTADVPVKSYGQATSADYGICYVREHNATQYDGTNYGVSLTAGVNGYAIGGEVAYPDIDNSKKYDIMYFAKISSARVLPLQTQFAPKVATISLKYCVYAQQNGGNSNGTLQGYLYFVVPRAQFTGDAGVSASQTENATTSYSWTALMPDSNMIDCADCGTSDTNYAYYVYIPCGDKNQDVQALVVVGGGVSVVAGGAGVQIPVLYLMPNGQTTTPVYTDLAYEADGTGVSVTAGGVVSGSTAGSGEVTITLKSDPTKITYCNVTVTAA